jgi:exopolysaccharide biosynthesis polyprenyl glycosylphosphotransferase
VELPERWAKPSNAAVPIASLRGEAPRPSRTARWQAFVLSPAFLVVPDVFGIAAGFWLAYFVRFTLEFPAAQEIQNARAYAGFLVTATPIFLASFMAYGLYQPRNLLSIADQLFRLVTAVLVGLVITVAVSSFVVRGWPDYSRLLLGYLWVGCTVLACAGRFTWVLWRDGLARRGDAVRTVLIVGASTAGRRVAEHFRQSPQLGYRVVGFLDDAPENEAARDYPVVGRVDDLDAALASYQPNEIILADPTLKNWELLEIVNRCQSLPVGIRIYPDVFQMLVTEASVVNLRGLQLLGVHATELQAWQRTVKRLFDVVFSATFLILASPLMLVIAILVKLDSPGPVFYAQERVGQDGKRFHAIKFRSMVDGAEDATGRFWTVKGDPRRTRLGGWLRRFSLDEIPQFANVLVGDMSVVGPRPERPMFVAQFSETVPDYLRRLRERAGITGWAQVNGLRGDVSIDERTKYDLYYVDNWSLWLDIKIIVRTAFLILKDPSAY